MKRLYEFTVGKKSTVKESETIQNESGEEITTTKEVKKVVDKKYFLRKPTRKLFDAAELFYGVHLSEGIKAGLLTRALLQKRFSNDGGTLGEKEREEWSTLYSDLFDKQVEFQQLSLKNEEERTPEENARLEICKDFLKDSRLRIQEFEMQQSSLFDQTAENRARNKTILWWVLQLAYYEDDEGDEKPFFGDGEYEDRIQVYDTLEEEEEPFSVECINKFFYYVSFWYVSKTSDPTQFEELIKFAEQQDLEEETTEVVIEEGEKTEEEPSEEEAENESEESSEENTNDEEDPFEDITEETPENQD